MSDDAPRENFATQQRLSRVWDEDQITAIQRCIDPKERIVAVSGGPGTGKTSLIEEVYKVLTTAGYYVSVSTPTGKAAKRVTEATGVHAVTNHRLLGYGMPIDEVVEDLEGNKKTVRLSTGPKYSRSNPLAYDFYLCDEYPMVNMQIHNELMAAAKPGARFRLFGDINQLRPIEENKQQQEDDSAFEAGLRKFNGVVLRHNHRQTEGSGISAAADALLRGRYPPRAADFEIRFTDSPVVKLIDTINELAAVGHHFNDVDHQIITCMHRSWVGTKKLNAVLQAHYWMDDRRAIVLPRPKWDKEADDIKVQVGSKVVYTANTYDMGNGCSAFNGEVGIIVGIDHEWGTLEVDFGDRVISIPPLAVIERGKDTIEFDPRANIDLAYALTTHKMQGSECRYVIYIMNKSTMFGQSRRNLYTGFTRAREKAMLITDQQSLARSVANNKR